MLLAYKMILLNRSTVGFEGTNKGMCYWLYVLYSQVTPIEFCLRDYNV